jgi:hypothetical protein
MLTTWQSAVSISIERAYISDTPVIKFKIPVADSIISIALQHIDSACNLILSNNTNIKQEVLRRTNRHISFETTRTAQKTPLPTILCCRGTSLQSCYLATVGGYTNRLTDIRVQEFFYCCIYSLPRELVYQAVA